MALVDIPTDELLTDRAASIEDIHLMHKCLALGITHHRDGMPVRYRLERNQEIVRTIDAELDRRNVAIP